MDQINQILTDDCLGHILDRLPLQDLKLSVARVCRRWNLVQMGVSQRRRHSLILCSVEPEDSGSIEDTCDLLRFYQVRLRSWMDPERAREATGALLNPRRRHTLGFFLCFKKEYQLLNILKNNFLNVEHLTIYCPGSANPRKPEFRSISPGQLRGLLTFWGPQLTHLKLLFPTNRAFIWGRPPGEESPQQQENPGGVWASLESHCTRLTHLSLHMSSYQSLELERIPLTMARLRTFHYGHDLKAMFVTYLFGALARHPNIVSFGFFNTHPGFSFCVNEQLTEGQTADLGRVVRRIRRLALPIQDHSGLLSTDLTGVEYLHLGTNLPLQYPLPAMRELRTIRYRTPKGCARLDPDYLDLSRVTRIEYQTAVDYLSRPDRIPELRKRYPSLETYVVYISRTPKLRKLIHYRDCGYPCTETVLKYRLKSDGGDGGGGIRIMKYCLPECECGFH